MRCMTVHGCLWLDVTVHVDMSVCPACCTVTYWLEENGLSSYSRSSAVSKREPLCFGARNKKHCLKRLQSAAAAAGAHGSVAQRRPSWTFWESFHFLNVFLFFFSFFKLWPLFSFPLPNYKQTGLLNKSSLLAGQRFSANLSSCQVLIGTDPTLVQSPQPSPPSSPFKFS